MMISCNSRQGINKAHNWHKCDIEPKEASIKETDTVKERKNIYYLNQKRFGDSNKELDIK